MRANSNLAQLISEAGLVGSKANAQRKSNDSSSARDSETQSNIHFDATGGKLAQAASSHAAPSLYEFTSQHPIKRSIYRASSARGPIPERSTVLRSNHPSVQSSSASIPPGIPPIHRAISSKSPSSSSLSAAISSSVISLPPAFSLGLDVPLEETSQRNSAHLHLIPQQDQKDPLALQSFNQIQPSHVQAWAYEPSSSPRALDQCLPRPIIDALKSAAAATEGAAKILTGGSESTLSQPLESSLIALVAALRGQLFNQSEESQRLLVEGVKREQEEKSKALDLNARLLHLTHQLVIMKKEHDSEIERLKEGDRMKVLRAVKAEHKVAEDKLDRSEVLRRNAERKAMSLEQELISARSQLDVKSAEYTHLSAQLSTEKSSREQLRNEMDLMIKSAVEEGKAQVRQSLQLIETEKKSLEAANVRLEADLAKRTQTLLSSQASGDALRSIIEKNESRISLLMSEKDALKEIPCRESPAIQVKGSLTTASSSLTDEKCPWIQDSEASKTPRRPHSSSKQPPTPPHLSPTHQNNTDPAKFQRTLLDLKEEYCQRLVRLEGDVLKAETSAATYASQLDRMASALASRTAILLMSSQVVASSPSPPLSSASSMCGEDWDGLGKTKSVRGYEAKGQVSKSSSVLKQMNEKLVSENSSLLVECARLQASQVKMKLLGSEGTNPIPAPSLNAAQDALTLVIKEALLSSRNKSLATVMTKEGWEGAAPNYLHHTKSPADAAISAAEDDLRARVSSLSLQLQLRELKAECHEFQTRLSAQANIEAELQLVKRELVTAESRNRSLETELKTTRTGTMRHDDDVSVASHSINNDRLEERMRSAKDEANRQKLLASAVRREKNLTDQELEESKRKIQRLEGQMREARNDNYAKGEVNKSLKGILSQARARMKEAGIDFLEDAYESSSGFKGSVRSSDAGSVVVEPVDGTLFKALDQREREKEMQRMQREVNEAQYQANLVAKDLKKAKVLLSQTQSDLQREKEVRAREAEASATELVELKASRKRLEDEKVVAESCCAEMKKDMDASKGKLAKMTLDCDYLRERSTQARPKPKLSYAKALSLTV